MLGYLRESEEKAIKCGPDKDNGLQRNGLDTYLKIIFPNTKDWIYNKPFGGSNQFVSRKRPDYRSQSLKLIVEFDGLPHYQNHKQYLIDDINTELYKRSGYKVVRIPYFIQLTSKVIKQLFSVDVNPEEVFPDNIPSFTKQCEALPTDMCLIGIYRMIEEFKKISPEQFEINKKYFKENNMIACDKILEKETQNFIHNIFQDC